MTKRIFIIISFSLIYLTAYSQDKANVKYWIIFKDKGEFKPDMPITKESPAYLAGKEMLTERAIKED